MATDGMRITEKRACALIRWWSMICMVSLTAGVLVPKDWFYAMWGAAAAMSVPLFLTIAIYRKSVWWSLAGIVVYGFILWFTMSELG